MAKGAFKHILFRKGWLEGGEGLVEGEKELKIIFQVLINSAWLNFAFRMATKSCLHIGL